MRSASLLSFIFIINKCYGTIDKLFDVWTNQHEAEILTEDEHKIAFRDVVLEGVARRVFQVFMNACQQGHNKTLIPGSLMIHDPQELDNVIHFKKQQKGLVDVEFKAWNLKIGGLHKLQIENLHVVRHIGLKDIRFVAQIVTDINFSGDYLLKGTGLSMLDLSGSGKLKMDVSRLMLTGETYLIYRENKLTQSKQLYVKNMDIKMKNDDMKIELENVLGGGFIGNMANEVLNLIGEDFLYAHKDTLTETVKTTFKNVLGQFLETEPIISS